MEPNTIPERPWTVTTAVYLLYVSLVFPSIGFFLFCLARGEAALFIVVFLGSLAIGTRLYYLIGRGETWARTTLLLFVLTTPLNIWFLAHQYGNIPELPGWIDASSLILGTAGVVLQFAALVLLFQRMSSEWFKAMKIHNLRLRTSA